MNRYSHGQARRSVFATAGFRLVSQAATLAHVFGHVAIAADPSMLKGRRFGNVVMAAGVAQLPTAWLPRMLAGGPHPASVLGGDELVKWIAGAPVATDATAVASPPPSKSVFSTR